MTWFDSNWLYRVKVTIQNAKVDTTMTDYAVYVDLSDLPSEFFDNVKSDGTDIVVTSSDGTKKLNRELVELDVGGSIGELHFKSASISSSVDTDFFIYYGNAGASETNDTATWDAKYKVVQHFNESSGNAADSTSNNNVGANNITAYRAAGQVGFGYDYEKADAIKTQTTDNSGLRIPGSWTISGWFRPESIGTNQILLFKDATFNGHQNYGLILQSSGELRCSMYDSSSSSGTTCLNTYNVLHTTPLVAGTMYKATGVYDTVAKTLKLYLNGSQVASTINISNNFACTNWSAGGGVQDLMFGGRDQPFANSGFDGIGDECRVGPFAYTANEISTEYNNQFDTSTFDVVGS